MKNIIFIAPPSAGKGTISDYFVKHYGYEHLSTGDLLRSEVARGTNLGKEINDIISKGNLVSDELIIRLVSQELEKLKDKPFILDGFPRTLAQAEELDQMLVTLGVSHNVVIYLDVPLDIAMARALGRVVCPKCKRSYNINNPKLSPQKNNICDDCGTILERRGDDTEETFRKRYETFLTSTSPITQFYQNKGMLVKVDATDELELIYEKILSLTKQDEA